MVVKLPRALLRRRQQGATMVEMAITLPLFFLLIFAIIEFALVLFTWGRAVDATRTGVRYAIVNTPVTSLEAMSCPGGSITANCGSAACDGLIDRMTALYPDLEASSVDVTYRCSLAGFDKRPEAIREVTVAISGQQYNLILPGLLGLEPTLTLPGFDSTRTSEDLNTP